MPASSDRNLLLGILCWQMDFITRDQLIAAMTDAAVQGSLAEICCRFGVLAEFHSANSG